MNPRNVKIRNNLGMELKAAGRIEEARYFYEVSGGLRMTQLPWFQKYL